VPQGVHVILRLSITASQSGLLVQQSVRYIFVLQFLMITLRSNMPVLISSCIWCCLDIYTAQQLLAAGDADGSLHVLEIPRAFRKKLPKVSLCHSFDLLTIYTILTACCSVCHEIIAGGAAHAQVPGSRNPAYQRIAGQKTSRGWRLSSGTPAARINQSLLRV